MGVFDFFRGRGASVASVPDESLIDETVERVVQTHESAIEVRVALSREARAGGRDLACVRA
jgi:hypothetical protein